jgi:aspartate kinase
MSHQPTVLKFGGTSVADARAFERVKRIVRGQSERSLVVVVSAMSGVTDALLTSAEMAWSGEAAAATGLLDRQVERHRAVADALLKECRSAFGVLLDAARDELLEQFRSAALRSKPRLPLRDSIASYGEGLAASLLASVLREDRLPSRYVDARRCIVTDDEHGNAKPLVRQCGRRIRAELEPLLAASNIPVMGGFIGATAGGATTTLGRNGSDYTAALVGGALAAKEIQIWTDVTGVLTTDPRVVTHARTIRRLSYAQAVKLACFGAKVIYPQAIRPAADRGIPIRILNSYAPDADGTLVCADADNSDGCVKAIAHKEGVSIVRIEAGETGGFRSELSKTLRQKQIVADAMTASKSAASLAISDVADLSRAVAELSMYGAVRVEERCAIVCLVGRGLSPAAEITARTLDALGRAQVKCVWHRAMRGSLLVAVPEEQAKQAVACLHDLLF